MIEQSDTTHPQSLRGVGHYGPSGPEAKIPNQKLPKKLIEGLPAFFQISL